VNILTRKDAKRLGLKRYFTGRPCRRGHIAERYVSTKTCVECSALQSRQWVIDNPERWDEYIDTWNKDNPALKREYERKWKWANIEHVRAHRKERYATDVCFRLAHVLRSRLGSAIKKGSKRGSAVDDLGCSIEQLKTHIETQFAPGMSWGNWGSWHIDHIKPLSSFDLADREQFLVACHYSNLQPLWQHDNQVKYNKA
jgi:hypothetical protein